MKNKLKSFFYWFLWSLPILIFILYIIGAFISNKTTGVIISYDEIIQAFSNTSDFFKGITIEQVSTMPYDIFINIFGLVDNDNILKSVFVVLGWSTQITLIRLMFNFITFIFERILKKLEV